MKDGDSHGEGRYAAVLLDAEAVSAELIQRFALAGPRYTSYPTADRFRDQFDPGIHASWLQQHDPSRPLSLYVHIPFCESLCYYCACNKIVTKDHKRAAPYIDYLVKESDLHLGHLGGRRRVAQLHWGGGTPTFLSDAEMERLIRELRARFDFDAEGEYAIEIDPRTVHPTRIALLRELGFNRLSIGVQDFDPEVQRAVHRIQPADLTDRAIHAARANGFASINLDLIYGLPRQTFESFARTVERVIETGAERIALYNYAHLPARFKPQRRIDEAECPDAATRVRIFRHALRTLIAAGYVYIGLDHFAKPNDALSQALRTGGLQRNFQGYSTGANMDLLALGVSAISKIGPMYSQNVRTLDEYYARLDADRLPVSRGIVLADDDRLRRDIIMALMCQGKLSIRATENEYGIDFEAYFGQELAELDRLAESGLVNVANGWIKVTGKGRLLLRAVCMVFDNYLRRTASRANYSRVA